MESRASKIFQSLMEKGIVKNRDDNECGHSSEPLILEKSGQNTSHQEISRTKVTPQVASHQDVPKYVPRQDVQSLPNNLSESATVNDTSCSNTSPKEPRSPSTPTSSRLSNIDDVSSPLSPITLSDSRASTPSLDSRENSRLTNASQNNYTLSGQTIEQNLQSCQGGRMILIYFEKYSRLSEAMRNLLVQLLIDKELAEDASKIISAERYLDIAQAIIKLFPSEDSQTYYIPLYVDERNKAHPAKGKLYDRFVYVRRKYRKCGLIAGRKKSLSAPIEEAHDEPTDVDPAVESKRLWLKSNTKPWCEVEACFQATVHHRLSIFKESRSDICAYFSLYPALCVPDEGYTLIDIDFNTLFPGKGSILYDKWDKIEPKLLEEAAFQQQHSRDFNGTLKSLGIDLTLLDPKVKTINSIFLLSALLPSISITTNLKPSKLESKDAFILHKNTWGEKDGCIATRNEKLEKYGLPPQPTILVIGELQNCDIYLRISNTVCYKFNSILKALDTCFKIYKVLGVKFPPDCLLPWLFLQDNIYNLPMTGYLKYPSLKKLAKDLKML